jgi:hypothetical protein
MITLYYVDTHTHTHTHTYTHIPIGILFITSPVLDVKPDRTLLISANTDKQVSATPGPPYGLAC